MVRKLALAVSLALGTLSVPAHALGLGELSSQSALNQQFSGTIQLLSVTPDEIGAVRVNLADQEAFSRAGIERPFYLTLLRFEPTLTPGGRPVVRVTSEFPIREPFLNFLIEVNWPNGRLLREYTVLLDPPTTTRRRPPQVAPVARTAPAPAAVATAAPRRAAPAAAVPAVSAPPSADGYDYGPVQANETAWSIAKKVRTGGISMEQMMMALLKANPQAFVDGNINRLRRGQILRVPSMAEITELGRQQARRAYRDHQDGWLARRDEQLRESAATAAAETPADAPPAPAASDSKDRLRIATARPDGEGEAGAGDDDAATPTASDLEARLIRARENAETSRQEAETLRSRVDDLQARLRDMQKLLSLKDEQLAQLQDRMVSGELAGDTAADAGEQAAETGELPEAGAPTETAQPAQTAQSADMAQVAATGDRIESGAAETTAGPAPDAVADYAIEDIAPQIDPDRIVEEAARAGGVTVDAGVAGDEGSTGPADEGPLAASEADGDATLVIDEGGEAGDGALTASTATVVTESGVAALTPATAPTALPAEPADAAGVDEGWLLPRPLVELIEQNKLSFAAGGAALLLLLGWLAMRGRRKPQDSGPLGDEATATAAAGTASATAAAVAAPAGGAADRKAADAQAVDADILADLPDSSFIDEFSPSDINALQDETGEVDPVSEADVYIAYGRYQQAEELLRQALARDPDRLALKHKLLEVHYATRNAEAFVALAGEMVDSGQDAADEAAWARAQDMGRELAPGNPLFAQRDGDATAPPATGAAAAGAAAATAATASSAIDDDTLALDEVELSELSAAYDEDNSRNLDLEPESAAPLSLDLDAASEISLDEEVARVEDTMVATPASISLDELDDLDIELPQAEAHDVAASEVDTETDIGDSFDLESMMAQAEAAIDGDSSGTEADSDFSADELQAQLDELSDLSALESATDQAKPTRPAEPDAKLGLVEEDTGFVSDATDQPISLDDVFEADEPESRSADVIEINQGAAARGDDDVTTKLDLARAYVEMGDEDGARSILEEVVAEGNETQKDDAERLLTRLG